ncbi:MAG: hypothetical protein KGM15_00835 [Pseudomonadota bacterium]|nr:hypothetical protein [Pseudomonadota bacterium]
MNAPTFLYIDYGASPYIGRELRYCLATLLAEAPDARVVVYTDKPGGYENLHPGVTARDLGADLDRWTRGGAYNHRIKPCVLLDALRQRGGVCVLLDTDSYIAPGFAATLRAAVANGPAMDHFEGRDPYPEIAGWRADGYLYDPAAALMYNSGLVAAAAGRDDAAVERAIGLIDALWDDGKRLFKIEQIALSEAFRLAGRPTGETAPAFQHYFRRSLKRYMHWRIDAWMRRAPVFAPTRPCIAHPRNAVRAFNLANRLFGRY